MVVEVVLGDIMIRLLDLLVYGADLVTDVEELNHLLEDMERMLDDVADMWPHLVRDVRLHVPLELVEHVSLYLDLLLHLQLRLRLTPPQHQLKCRKRLDLLLHLHP